MTPTLTDQTAEPSRDSHPEPATGRPRPGPRRATETAPFVRPSPRAVTKGASARLRLPRFGLSMTQLIASALAAITATVAASYLGVSGTVVGAAVASVLTAVGNAVYAHSLRRTGDRVRVVVPAAARIAPRPAQQDLPPALPTPRPRPVRAPRPDAPVSPWRRVAFATVALFVAVLTVVTGIEVVAGRPISDIVRGDSGAGTTVFGAANTTKASSTTPAPTQTVTQTVTPVVVVTTPTVTRTAAPTTTTVTPTPSPSTTAPTSPASSTAPTSSAARSTPAP